MKTEPTPVNAPPPQTNAVAMPLREETEASAKARIMIHCLARGYSEQDACFAAELYADKYFY